MTTPVPDYPALDRAHRHQAICALMTLPEGKAFLWWLLTVGKALGQNPMSPDPLTTAFVCGEMQVGHQIMAEIIEADVTALPKLMLEMENERQHRDRNRRDADAGSRDHGDLDDATRGA